MFELSRIFIVLNMWTFQFFCRPNAGNIHFWIKFFRKAFRELQSNFADFRRWRHALVMISCSNCFVISLHLFLIKNKKKILWPTYFKTHSPKKNLCILVQSLKSSPHLRNCVKSWFCNSGYPSFFEHVFAENLLTNRWITSRNFL